MSDAMAQLLEDVAVDTDASASAWTLQETKLLFPPDLAPDSCCFGSGRLLMLSMVEFCFRFELWTGLGFIVGSQPVADRGWTWWAAGEGELASRFPDVRSAGSFPALCYPQSRTRREYQIVRPDESSS